MANATFRIWRGDKSGGQFRDYSTEISEGMVVLDAVHHIQAEHANDMAVRWNCKAGKCGSCSAEINGMPKLMCMTRLNTLPLDQPVTIQPMQTFPLIKDLVTDVSWNYKVKMGIKKLKPRKPDAPDGSWRMDQADVDRPQEFRKCIECFLCQDVCHVLRDHQLLRRIYRAPFPDLHRAVGDEPDRYRRPGARFAQTARHRLLQHHQVLHQGLSGKHHHHR